MRKGDATRARIIEEAGRQAAIRGLSNVSLGDVAEAVSLSKSGLFKHFADKEAMQLAVVEEVMERFTDRIWRPAEPLAPGRERLDKIFACWLHWGEEVWADSGCPVLAFSIELDDQPGPLRDLLRKRLQGWRKTLVREFRALRDPPLGEAEAQAAYFQMKSFILGHSDARRMLGDADAYRIATDAFEGLLDRTAKAN